MAETSDVQKIAAALAGLGAGIGGRALANRGGDPLTQAVPPQLSQLLDQQVQRQTYQNPLFQATTQGVYAMLPTFAKQGTSLGASLPAITPSAGGPGTSGPGLGTAAGLGGAAALASLLGKAASGGGGDLAKIINGIKKLFGHGSPAVQGDQPLAGGGLPSGNPGMNGFTGFDDGGGNTGTPGVTTSETFSWPTDILNDPTFLNSLFNGPTDPSGGTGVGPGMQAYYDDQGSGYGPEPSATWGG